MSDESSGWEPDPEQFSPLAGAFDVGKPELILPTELGDLGVARDEEEVFQGLTGRAHERWGQIREMPRLQTLESIAGSFGVRDTPELFAAYRDGLLLADIVRDAAPEDLAAAIGSFASNNAIAADGQTGLDRIMEDDVWNNIKLFFGRYSLVRTDYHELFVPVFCAHPVEPYGGKFGFSYQAQSTSASSFHLRISGLSGGFGNSFSVTEKLASQAHTVSFQLQAKVRFAIRTWRNRSRVAHTYAPVQQVGKRGVSRGQGKPFIEYDRSTKDRPAYDPFEWDVTGSVETRKGIEIRKGASDSFKIEVPIYGIQAALGVESSATEQFEVSHEVRSGYRYTYVGSRWECHDVFVEAEPL